MQIVKPYNSDLEVNILISGDFYCSFICDSFVRDDSPANTSTLIFGWKWKLSRRTLMEVVWTLAKQSWSNVDRITSIQCWWPNVNSTLIFGWKRKLSQGMLISLASTLRKQHWSEFFNIVVLMFNRTSLNNKTKLISKV